MNNTSSGGLTPSGSFENRALGSSRAFDVDDFITDEPILGLTREAGYMWGSLRDEEGTLYSTMRRVSRNRPETIDDGWQSMSDKFVMLSTGTGGPGMGLRKEPRVLASSETIGVKKIGDNTAEFTSAPDAEGNPVRLVLSEDDFSYVEEGILDFTGKLAAPPLQWFLPGRNSALLYLTQTWFVEGSILGKPARGFLFWEEAWMYPGGRLYRKKDPIHDAEYFTWYSWANHWEDGTSEVGHFLFGQHDFHVAVTAHSDGTTTSASSMDAVVTRSADGHWHDGIAYTIDGVEWVCEPDPEGQMHGLGYMPNPQQEGRMHRVGDTRQPDVWMAWGESVPAAGTRRRERTS